MVGSDPCVTSTSWMSTSVDFTPHMTSEVVPSVATWYASAMRLHSHLLLAALAVGSLASAQAMRPPPAAAPAPAPAVIIQQPPSYPGATYTPTGTGLPAMGQPGSQRPAVERSPNKRVLPPTKEPGLWAADGAPRAGEEPGTIFGAPVQLPEHPPLGATAVRGVCAYDMARAAGAARMKLILSFPDAVRACMAASAYFQCVLRHAHEAPKKAGWAEPSGWDPAYLKKAVMPIAEKEMKKACAGVTMTEEQSAALRAVLEKYAWGPKDWSME